MKKEIAQTLYEWELRDRRGRLIKKGRGKSHSWLKIVLLMLKGEFATRYAETVGNGNESIPDQDGNLRNYPFHSGSGYGTYFMNWSALGDTGDINQGIAIGSDDTPNDVNQFGLNSKIAHGSESGQLLYGAMTVESPTNPSGGIWQFRAIRTFTNNSGADVIVKEVGFIVRKFDAAHSGRSWCLIRDVLDSPITIPDGASFTWRYIFQLQVS